MHNFMQESKDGLAHVYVSSITNQVIPNEYSNIVQQINWSIFQVIERWWRDYRERNGNFFRAYIQELVATGLYGDKDDTARLVI